MKHLVLLRDIINELFHTMRKVKRNELKYIMMKQSVEFNFVDAGMEL